MRIPERKFFALLICLAAVCITAAFGLDTAVGISTLYGIFVCGNAASKFSHREENNSNK